MSIAQSLSQSLATPIPMEVAAVNLGAAVTLGALIGSERQVRQRMAGLRTNALVALGAASFVLFAALFPHEVSPTRVAAQVVSGIGFLGAGIIFRDGFNVHGLNTAATLWCSASVGMLAGAGFLLYAALGTGLVVFVNLGLRPLVKWLKRHTRAGVPLQRQFRVTLTCPPEREGRARALMLGSLSAGGLHISEVESRAVPEGVELSATITAEGVPDTAVEQAVGRLLLEPGLGKVGWQPCEES